MSQGSILVLLLFLIHDFFLINDLSCDIPLNIKLFADNTTFPTQTSSKHMTKSVEKISKWKNSLVTIYKAFFIAHLSYGDLVYNKAFNSFSHESCQSIPYNACLALISAVRVT